jgi:hypothetical protein
LNCTFRTSYSGSGSHGLAAAGDAAKVVLIDVDYKAAPLLSFSLQQHRVDRRRRERLAALIHNATLSQLGGDVPQ